MKKPLISAALVLFLWLPTTISANGAAAAARSGLKTTLQAIDYRYFVAGGVCAATSHGITTPIDVVKTRMQADPLVYNKGIREAALSILKTDGPNALLGGLGPTVIGYGIEGAMKFGVYEVMKPLMSQLFSGSNTPMAYIAASVIAGAVASVLLCPMESARIRIVTDASFKELGLRGSIPKLIQNDGFWGLFGGIYAMLSKQIPYTMAKQVSFDIVAGMLYSLLASFSSTNKADLKWAVSFLSAFVASIFACIFSQPGDMILTETYKGSKRMIDGKEGGSGFVYVVQKIHERGGLTAFFTGTGARILHVSTIITTQLVIYDIVKQLLGLPATGSH